MRVANKNEILVLLGSCATSFATFCVSPAGAVTKFLFDNATGFDLDSDLVAELLMGLHQGGIVDDAALGRLAAFGVDVTPAVVMHAYRAPVGYPLPAAGIGWGYSATHPGYVVFVVPYLITDGIAIEEAAQ
jgi:hypothetical protein